VNPGSLVAVVAVSATPQWIGDELMGGKLYSGWLSQIDISLSGTDILVFWNGATWVAEDKFLGV
jgi:hypothetical protein